MATPRLRPLPFSLVLLSCLLAGTAAAAEPDTTPSTILLPVADTVTDTTSPSSPSASEAAGEHHLVDDASNDERMRKKHLALAGGISFLLSDFASFGGLALRQQVLKDPNYIVGQGPDPALMVSCLLDLLVAFTNIGTAVSLYPLLKDENEGVAMGYVGLRTLEAAVITAGVVSLLAISTLRQQNQSGMAGDPTALVATGRGLTAFHNATFLMGPGFTSGLNTVFLSALLAKSNHVPRWIAILGLIGGPLVFGSAAATLTGLLPQYAVLPALLAIPQFVFEASLASYLIYKGVSPSVAW